MTADKESPDDIRSQFELFVSAIVRQEASSADPEAARRRLEVIDTITELDVPEAAIHIAEQLLTGVPLPEKAQIDALHIAIAAIHGIDYLLTWNCRHIANVTNRSAIERVIEDAGYSAPLMCTPHELAEATDHD